MPQGHYPRFKAAACHAAPVFLNTAKTVEKACDWISEAARNGASLIVFPESFISGFPVWTAVQVDMPHAYVVYDHARPRNVKLIRDWLAGHDILLAGRYSEWEYYNSDHAFLAGKRAAEQAARGVRAEAALEQS